MEYASGNIYIRKMKLAKGQVVPGHEHVFDHTTIVFKGSIRVKAVTPDGRTMDRVFIAPDSFLVKADVRHEITALVDDTEAWCVYSHRNAQGDVVQEYTGLWDAPHG